jgi:hypothetical protein
VRRVTITPNNEKAKQVGTSEGLLVETYGLPLLSYLCATDEDQMHRRLDETGELSPAAETVLTTHLLAIAQQVASRLTEQPNFPRTFALEFLSESTSDTGPSIGNAIRLAAGGALPENRLASIPADEVKTFITRMAIDVYPALLVPSDLDWMQPRNRYFDTQQGRVFRLQCTPTNRLDVCTHTKIHRLAEGATSTRAWVTAGRFRTQCLGKC